MNKYIQEDALRLLHEEEKLFFSLQGKSVFVTGGTGLIGSNLIFALLEANRMFNLDIRVLALVRNRTKAKNLFESYVGRDQYLEIIEGDVLHLPDINQQVDYVVHGASLTSSQSFIEKPVDTIDTAILGTKNILELAKLKKVEGFVYLSSLEVYGIPKTVKVYEDTIGCNDFFNIRSSYSESKRMVETLCLAYGKQYGIPIKVARLGQTFGPGVDYGDNRVFAQFARAVLEQRDIVLHTLGETARNYCYTRDAVRAILYILLRGKQQEAYNVANMDTYLSIREMANLVVSLDEKKERKVVVDLQDVQKFGYNPIVQICLVSEKLEQLGWYPRVGIKEMFIYLIAYMKEQKESYGH